MLSNRAPETSLRILVIDDDEDFLRFAQLVLERLGHEAVTHKGPWGTLMAVRRAAFDLVLLDMNMPGLSGTWLIDLLRATTPTPRIMLCSASELRTLQRFAKALRIEAIDKVAFKEDGAARLAEALHRAPVSATIPPPSAPRSQPRQRQAF